MRPKLQYRWDYPINMEVRRLTKKTLIDRRKEFYNKMDHSRMDYLTAIVAQVWGLKPEYVKGRNNIREYVEARHTVMWFATIKDKRPLWYIGAYLDWRDHSTVIHGRDTVECTLMGDKEYDKKLEEVLIAIKNFVEPIKEKIESLNELNSFH